MRPFVLAVSLLLVGPLAAQIVNIEEMRITGTNDSLRWYGSLKGAFNLTQVKERTTILRGEGRVQYKQQRHIALGLLHTDFLRAGNRDFVNSAFAHLRYNYKWRPALSVEVYAQQQTNRLILIQQRRLAGVGLRRRFFLNYRENSRLYLGSSYLYEWNQFIGELGLRDWHRLSNYLTLTLRNRQYKGFLQGTTYWQPVIGWIRNYRLSTEWTLELPIGRHLRFSTDFAYSLDRSLPEAAPLQIFNWQNGLVWRW